MPSGLFKRDGERWVFSGETPASFSDYHRDHTDLLVRYMFQMTPDEQRRLMSTSPVATSSQTSSPPGKEPAAATPNGNKVSRARHRQITRRHVLAAHAKSFGGRARAPDRWILGKHRDADLTRE
jgi:hypothetical protein